MFMTSELKQVLSKVDTLSEEDLKALQKHISERLHQKDNKVDLSKIGYRLSPEKIREQLSQVFSPEELAEATEDDFDEPLNLPKSLTEYISEDREDRF
jgi:hypothetical protein